MKYCLRYNGDTMDEIRGWVQAAEQAGFQRILSQELHTSPFVYPAAAAGFTSRIELGAAVAIAFVRSPLSMAVTALDIDRLSGGRFVLGLGAGVKGLVEYWHGVEYGRPAPHLKECIQVTRLLLDSVHAGDPIRFDGEYYKINIVGFASPHPPARERIPIHAAAMGPGMVRNVAEVADGIMGQMIATLPWVRDVMVPNMKIGLDRAGRKREEIELQPTLTIAISNDKKQAYRDLAKSVAFYATVGTYKDLFAHYGYSEEAAAVRAAFREHGGHGPHCWDLVPDDMVEAFCAGGSADDVRRRAAEYEGVADSLSFAPPMYSIEPEQMDAYQRAALETFAS